jgi:hypothetical protein
LQRLHDKREQFEKKDLIDYQNHLKFIAGESPEGKCRLTRLKYKRENSLNKLGITLGENKQGYFIKRAEETITETPAEQGSNPSEKLSPNLSINPPASVVQVPQ